MCYIRSKSLWLWIFVWHIECLFAHAMFLLNKIYLFVANFNEQNKERGRFLSPEINKNIVWSSLSLFVVVFFLLCTASIKWKLFYGNLSSASRRQFGGFCIKTKINGRNNTTVWLCNNNVLLTSSLWYDVCCVSAFKWHISNDWWLCVS